MTFLLKIENHTITKDQKCKVQILEENKIIDQKNIMLKLISKLPPKNATKEEPLVLPNDAGTSYKGGSYLYMNYYSLINTTITPVLNCGGPNVAYGPGNRVTEHNSTTIKVRILPYAFDEKDLQCELYLKKYKVVENSSIKIHNYGYEKTTNVFYAG